MSEQHLCPVCSSSPMRRAERQGVLEQSVLPFFGYFPWRCKHCMYRAYLRDRGDARFYFSSDGQKHKRQDSESVRDEFPRAA